MSKVPIDKNLAKLIADKAKTAEEPPVQEVKPVAQKTTKAEKPKRRKPKPKPKKEKQQTKEVVIDSKFGRRSPFPIGTEIKKGSYQLPASTVDAMRKAIFNKKYLSQNELIDVAVRKLLGLPDLE